ncbi:MAG: right-handed parallel beta-helix repeat-containing protein, partial [Tannerella sp.]|nr:right-handed parallel beta-helix repeat-containing protein [Tannerella sp.]
MKKILFIAGCMAALLFLSRIAQAGNADGPAIYTAPDGTSAGTGAIDSPMDIYTAVARIEAGGTVYMRGGVYYLTRGVDLDKAGSEAAPYRLWAYPGEQPVFDCSQETVPNANNLGIRMTNGYWWHIRGLEIRNAYNSGFKVRNGSHNTFENCVAHHNGSSGFHIGFEHETGANPDGSLAAYNTWLNCDAYNNFDWWSTSGEQPRAGTNADGFACKSNAGKGNRYIGCCAWNNSDDNWDFFECGYGIQLIDCWAWNAGIMSDHTEMYLARTGNPLTATEWDGNGNGFKIGGGCLNIAGRTCQLESRGTHVLRGCIAFRNNVNGFDQNNHPYGAVIENCIGFSNRCNFRFYDPNKSGTAFIFRNSISWGGSSADTFNRITMAADAGNSWNQPGLTSDPAAAFVSLSVESAKAARGADGSLPEGFARLKPNSVFIDKGVPTAAIDNDADEIHLPAIESQGMAPDMGAFEHRTASGIESLHRDRNADGDQSRIISTACYDTAGRQASPDAKGVLLRRMRYESGLT